MTDQQQAWTPERIAALRLMSREFFDLMYTADPTNMVAQMEVAVLGGALAGFVPELLDEIERLRLLGGRVSNAGAQFYVLLGFVVGVFGTAVVATLILDWTR